MVRLIDDYRLNMLVWAKGLITAEKLPSQRRWSYPSRIYCLPPLPSLPSMQPNLPTEVFLAFDRILLPDESFNSQLNVQDTLNELFPDGGFEPWEARKMNHLNLNSRKQSHSSKCYSSKSWRTEKGPARRIGPACRHYEQGARSRENAEDTGAYCGNFKRNPSNSSLINL